MLSRSTIKYIKQLQLKKNREKEGIFFAEGRKIAIELLESDFKIISLFASAGFIESNKEFVQKSCATVQVITSDELKLVSLLKHPEDCLVVAEQKNPPLKFPTFNNKLVIYLDGIRDPGNLGTIIRICDWFGIENLICSPDCVDAYNPKVIQASMGSFLRVMPGYLDFTDLVNDLNEPTAELPVIYGTFMSGENVLTMEKFTPGILVIGSEANGIRSEILQFINRKITIPRFSDKVESLNAAIATSVVVSQFMRLNS